MKKIGKEIPFILPELNNFQYVFKFQLSVRVSLREPCLWAAAPNSVSLKQRMIFRAGQLVPGPASLVMAFVNWGVSLNLVYHQKPV